MSSGSFVSTRYQASYGDGLNVHPIKIQPETTGLTIAGVVNIPTSTQANSPISALVSAGKRVLGLKARKVTFKFTGGNPVGGVYKTDSPLTLPWFTPFPSSFVKGADGTYLGETIILIGTSPESVS